MKQVIMVVSLALATSFAHAQNSTIPQPFLELRFDEQYHTLKDSLPLQHGLDKLKYLPISKNNDWFLTVGGEARQTFELVRLGFTSQETDSYGLTRLGLNASINFISKFRVYGEIMSALQYYRDGGSRPVDENQLYFLNLFTDVKLLSKGVKQLTLRIGRQELQFGSSSLFSIRDGTNVRYSFDGTRAIFSSKKLDLDLFYADYVRQDFGVFDDKAFKGDKKVWGSYINYKLLNNGSITLQPFYAGLKELSFYHQIGLPTRNDLRHSFGLRIHGKKNSWDYGVETIVQRGRVDEDLTVKANQAAVKVDKGHKIGSKSLFKYGIRGYFSSGDHDSLDSKINTFNPYFPLQQNLRGAFGTLTFPTNLIFTGPSFTWIYNKKLITSLSYDFYWRSNTQDGLMNPGGFTSLYPDKSQNKFLGSQADVLIVYNAAKFLNLVMVYSHFFESDYTRARPSANSATDFLTALIVFKI